MAKMIFINLPVENVEQSKRFYETIGFVYNPQFSDGNGACMVVNENIFVMLLNHKKFGEFTSKRIIDAKKEVAVLNSLSMGSAEELNATIKKALSAGAAEYRDPQDFGFMQLRCFEDLDGHNWELSYMDMAKFGRQ